MGGGGVLNHRDHCIELIGQNTSMMLLMLHVLWGGVSPCVIDTALKLLCTDVNKKCPVIQYIIFYLKLYIILYMLHVYSSNTQNYLNCLLITKRLYFR